MSCLPDDFLHIGEDAKPVKSAYSPAAADRIPPGDPGSMRLIRSLLLLALLAAFAAWVWPTRYRWDHLTVDGNFVPVRIDRFSGDADMLVPDEGWVPVEGTDSPGDASPSARHS
jgi:hypothetical protein